MKNLRTGQTLTAALTLSILALTSPALAQEGSGREVRLTFSQGLEFSDNPELTVGGDSGTTTRTSLGLEFSSETRTQFLSFELGTDIVGEFGGSASDDFEREDSQAILRYELEGANSELSFLGSYTETFLDDSVFLSGGTLVIDTGVVNATYLDLSFETGIEGPFGLEVDATYTDRDYRNTSDPDLNDIERLTLDVLAHVRTNRSVSFRGRAGIRLEDEQDAVATERDRHYVGVGIEGETAGGLSYFGDLIYDQNETTTNIPTVSEDDGLGVEIGLTQERGNGEIGLSITSRVRSSGRRTVAEVNRSIEFPSGDVDFSLGVVDQENDDSARLIAGFDYNRETAAGDISASLSQNAVTDAGTAYLNTRLALNFRREINAVSSWDAGLTYFESNELGGTDDDARGTATIAYSRDLTEDWNMRAGLEHTLITETGAADRESNTVFFNIERDITFGF